MSPTLGIYPLWAGGLFERGLPLLRGSVLFLRFTLLTKGT